MKQILKRRKFLIPASIMLVFFIGVACKKSFLDKPPLGTLNPAIIATPAGVQGLLIGAYSLVDGEGAPGDGFASGASNWIYGGVAADDAYKGSDPTDVAVAAPYEVWTTLDPTNGSIPQKWTALYTGIQRSNEVLRIMAITPGLTDVQKAQISAQARFLRAFYHFEAKKIFNNVPYIDETISSTNINLTNSVDIWPKIEADLNYAISNLPAKWSGEPGRINVWGAKAMLAKAYMYEKKYTAAYPILQDLIANGITSKGDKYALLPNYYNNFNPAQKNSAESVFAAQTSVQDGSSVDWGGDPNGNYGDILNFPYNGGPGACCGFYNPSQDLANAYKTDATGMPFLDESYAAAPNITDPLAASWTGNVDPRLDWVVGRPGLPYLDWGLHPGDAWIRNPVNDGHFSPKKDVYAVAQKGQFTDAGSAYWAPTELTANNVNIIRFADVLLWAAECAVQAGDIPTAMGYVNQVRARAADPTTWVYAGGAAYNAGNATYSPQTTPADKYKIGLYTALTFTAANALKAVQFERRLELAMEGQRFFDLVRWGIAAPTINTYIAREKVRRPLKANANFTAGKNEYSPIPQSEIDNMNSDGVVRLKQNPGY